MEDTIHYVSAQSLADLKKELETIKNNTIPEIAKRIDEAKQQGDLSENAEYTQAREDMSWAQGKAIELEQIITNSQIITHQTTGVVGVGSVVVAIINDKERELTIVGPQEVNPAKGLISNESPLGQALIGHKAGEQVEVSAPAGKIHYTIKAVK